MEHDFNWWICKHVCSMFDSAVINTKQRIFADLHLPHFSFALNKLDFISSIKYSVFSLIKIPLPLVPLAFPYKIFIYKLSLPRMWPITFFRFSLLTPRSSFLLVLFAVLPHSLQVHTTLYFSFFFTSTIPKFHNYVFLFLCPYL